MFSRSQLSDGLAQFFSAIPFFRILAETQFGCVHTESFNNGRMTQWRCVVFCRVNASARLISALVHLCTKECRALAEKPRNSPNPRLWLVDFQAKLDDVFCWQVPRSDMKIITTKIPQCFFVVSFASCWWISAYSQVKCSCLSWNLSESDSVRVRH